MKIELYFDFTEKQLPKSKPLALTPKQIETFASKLAHHSAFGGRYAKTGETMGAFKERLKRELTDKNKLTDYLPYLREVGFTL